MREGHLGGQTFLVATRVSQTGRESSCTCSPALCKAPFFPGSPKHQLLATSLYWLLTLVPGNLVLFHHIIHGQSFGPSLRLHHSNLMTRQRQLVPLVGREGGAEDRPPKELRRPHL